MNPFFSITRTITLGNHLPKLLILLVRNLLLITSPNSRIGVDMLVFEGSYFFHLGRLFFLRLFSLNVFCVKFIFVLLLFFYWNFDFFYLSEVYGVSDEFRVVSDHFLQLSGSKVLISVLLQMQRNLCSPPKSIPPWIRANVKTSFPIQTFPNMLHIIIIILTRHGHLIRHQEGGIKSNTKHTNHTNIRGPLSQSLHKVGSTRSCHSSKIGNQILLRHTHTSITNSQRTLIRIILNLHLQIGSIPQHLRLGHTQKANLIKSVTRVGNELTEEYVLVGVEGVHDNVEHFVYLGFVGEGGGSSGRCVGFRGVDECFGGFGGEVGFGCLFVFGEFGVGECDIANDGRGNDAKSSNKSGSESELVKAYHGSGGC
mmetsp:Transcript_20234/g.43637  ORF Transcript_20234/g.43637 Transcript_20234/m.43637 type:complete len:369 (+) Transcript_20234:1545-2651(+)